MRLTLDERHDGDPCKRCEVSDSKVALRHPDRFFPSSYCRKPRITGVELSLYELQFLSPELVKKLLEIENPDFARHQYRIDEDPNGMDARSWKLVDSFAQYLKID